MVCGLDHSGSQPFNYQLLFYITMHTVYIATKDADIVLIIVIRRVHIVGS